MTDSDYKTRALKKAYIRSFRGGRRAFGMLLDAVVFGAVIIVTLYIVIRPRFQNRPAALAATLFCALEILLVYAAVTGLRFRRHVKKLRREAAREIAENKQFLQPELIWERVPESPSVRVIKSMEKITADDVLTALRSNDRPVTLVSLAGATAAAERVIAAAGGDIKVTAPKELGIDPSVIFPASEDELDDLILRKHGAFTKKKRSRISLTDLSGGRAIKYLAVGAALTLASFVVRYPIYYRAVASVSLGIGSYALIAEKLFKKQSAPTAGSERISF